MGRIVGIDLGTTNSVLAVLEGGRPVVVANAEGLRTTPSVVGFSREKELLVGQAARRQLVLNPRDSFSNLKRLIGRQWQELDEASQAVAYTIRANDLGQVRVVCPPALCVTAHRPVIINGARDTTIVLPAAAHCPCAACTRHVLSPAHGTCMLPD